MTNKSKKQQAAAPPTFAQFYANRVEDTFEEEEDGAKVVSKPSALTRAQSRMAKALKKT